MDIHCEPSDSPTELCAIIESHGSDKGGLHTPRHQYTRYYSNVFSPVRNKPLTIFEMGVGTYNEYKYGMGPSYKPGSSLRAWSEFFPHSKLYGADIDKTILFQTDRIQTFYCDQLDWRSIQDLWKHEELNNQTFDIMIDDGCHEIQANEAFFENSIHKLNPRGVFIIEDIHPEQEQHWLKKISEWCPRYNLDGKFMLIPNPHFPLPDGMVVFYKRV